MRSLHELGSIFGFSCLYPIIESNLLMNSHFSLAAQQMSAASAVEVMERTGENVHPLPRAQQRSGSSASNASDEDTEDHKSGGRSQSRIDKWKAKHEAMLKMAASDKDRKQDKQNHSKNNSASSEDEHESTSANGLKTNGVCQVGLPKPASVPTALSVQ